MVAKLQEVHDKEQGLDANEPFQIPIRLITRSQAKKMKLILQAHVQHYIYKEKLFITDQTYFRGVVNSPSLRDVQ